jgi:hypothetical protein
VTPTQLHIEVEVDQLLDKESEVISDLNDRRENSSVVMFFLFEMEPKQAIKQDSESKKRERLDNRFTIFESVWMRDEAKTDDHI